MLRRWIQLDAGEAQRRWRRPVFARPAEPYEQVLAEGTVPSEEVLEGSVTNWDVSAQYQGLSNNKVGNLKMTLHNRPSILTLFYRRLASSLLPMEVSFS